MSHTFEILPSVRIPTICVQFLLIQMFTREGSSAVTLEKQSIHRNINDLDTTNQTRGEKTTEIPEILERHPSTGFPS